MPAKKSYKKSQIEAALDAIMKLPAGAPTEPEFDREGALNRMKNAFRQQRKNNVSFEDIVKELNGHGIKATVGELKKIAGEGPKVNRRDTVPPMQKGAADTTKLPDPPKSGGTFNIAPDPEGI